MLNPIITIEDWSGGQTFNPSYGRKNQYFGGIGVDHYSRAGYLTTLLENINMTNVGADVGSKIFCGKWVSTGDNYFGGENGQIFKQNAFSTVALAHTSTNNFDNITDMIEYQGYLYYAQSSGIIGRMNILTLVFTDNWQTGLSVGNNGFPMVVSPDNKLYIGNRYYVSQYYEPTTTWVAQALNLPTDYDISSMENFGRLNLSIGANSINGSSYSLSFIWDRIASTWNNVANIPENNIYGQIQIGGNIWILAGGQNLALYVLPVGSLTPTLIKRFYQESPLQNAISWRNAIAYRDGRLYFGISGVDARSQNARTLWSGVFSISVDLSKLDMNCIYQTPISAGNPVQNIYFVGLMYSKRIMFSSYYIQGVTSIKKLLGEDNSNYTTQALLVDSFWYQAPAGKKFYFEGFAMEMYPRKAGQSFALNIYTDNDHAASTPVFNTQVANEISHYKPMTVECRSIMFQISLTDQPSNTIDRGFIKRLFATGKLIDDVR